MDLLLPQYQIVVKSIGLEPHIVWFQFQEMSRMDKSIQKGVGSVASYDLGSSKSFIFEGG